MFEEFDVKQNELLSNYSTVKIGGLAEYIIFPKNYLEIKKIIKICKKNNKKYYILGNGSNILFDDKGFDGVLINLKHLNTFKLLDKKDDIIDSKKVFVGAGINLFALNQKLKDSGLSGLEWSYGIPATLGGFIVMNGGCYGHEIFELIEKVFVLAEGKFLVLSKEQIDFSYRHTSLKDNCIVLGAILKLKHEKSQTIEQNMKEFLNLKKASQPCEFPSLGSVFKRFEKDGKVYFPAKLIDNMGLKGVKIGGAEVSKKHAGFIINQGGATSKDFLNLVVFIEEKFAEMGMKPEREIIVLR